MTATASAGLQPGRLPPGGCHVTSAGPVPGRTQVKPIVINA